MARRRQSLFAKLALWALAGLIGFALATATQGDPGAPDDMLPPSVPILENPELPEGNLPPDEPGGYVEPEAIFRGYLGVHGSRIAVYRGNPSQGELQYVTEYEVREDVREQLESGVPFADTEELLQLLENFTS